MSRVWLAATLCVSLAWPLQAGDAPETPQVDLPDVAQDAACTTCDARQAGKARLRELKKALAAEEAESVGTEYTGN